ncbi:MAG TPA: cytochrome c biogenesis protein CcsA [Candidatus Xenobia bacterium]|jgi:ABC-type transport system involved in cytochrome c biogenesis permease subunit
MKLLRILLLLALLAVGQAWADAPTPPQPVQGLDLTVLKGIPVQDAGRYKPFDTLARETVQKVTGKERFQGWDPNELLLSWMSNPAYWRSQPIVEIRNEAVKKAIGLKVDDRWFKMDDLGTNAALEALVDKVSEKRRSEEKLNALDKAAQNVYEQFTLFHDVTTGEILRIIPHPTSSEEKWIAIGDLNTDAPDLKGYTHADLTPTMAAFQALLVAYTKADAHGFYEQSINLASALQKLPKAAGVYPEAGKMALEVEYNRLHPFQWSWILFCSAFVVLLLFSGSKSKAAYWSGMLVYTMALGMTVYGFFLRCMIAGRPPVTNMYESVIWVSFGATLFAFIFELRHHTRRFALAASAVGTIGFILADNLPTVLSANIEPLPPVLRSNLWLTIHVLTITLSYAAFLLTFGLGHQGLWNYLRNPGKRHIIAPIARYIYKAMQVGVLLVAAGTILGGVWANYSWGRFWGWDPKEVWALIVLLSYLVILHGRYAGYLQDFGTTVCSVICFLSVMMAWYGVNFILGVGLHSYGFGTGGAQYVAGFIGADLAFVGYVAYRYKNWLANNKPEQDRREDDTTED